MHTKASLLKVLAAVNLLRLPDLEVSLLAQSAGVPVYAHTAADENTLRASAEKLRQAGQPPGEAVLTSQFNRSSCELKLPPANAVRLSGRDLWAAARAAHLRVGWYFLCTKCKNRHLNLAAGYAISKDGAVATCFHVVAPPDNLREGFLVVADEEGKVYPVTEILAASKAKDVCLLRVDAKNLKPLPLNTGVFPGDRCVCFSDPLGERGYYSDGIVSRFLVPTPPRKGGSAPEISSSSGEVMRMNVTTDWAPGSSGAAVLDECGNAIGHVTSIATLGDSAAAGSKRRTGPTLITLHEAVTARDVLSLIKQK